MLILEPVGFSPGPGSCLLSAQTGKISGDKARNNMKDFINVLIWKPEIEDKGMDFFISDKKARLLLFISSGNKSVSI
ncbi:MAG: hypothetical protein ACE5EN_00515 [Nitrospinota bacterium]